MKISQFPRSIVNGGVAALILNSCWTEVHEGHREHYEPLPARIADSNPNPVAVPVVWREQVVECADERRRDGKSGQCAEQDRRRWMSNCKSDYCQAVRVNVHYMLTRDLGSNNRVVVEAFDNSRFSGTPVSSLEVTNFDASHPGTHTEDAIFLEPGEYFLRAYISNDRDPSVPYEYQGMELVGDQPVGFYGALSQASKVVIDYRSDWTAARSINIYLDKLMRRAGEVEPTHAHLRIQLRVAEGIDIPLAHKVLIQLFDREDFSYDPKVVHEMATESLRVEGLVGRGEFISPDLAIGDYFVRAFIDLSKNGYFDAGEPVAVYSRNGEAGVISIESHRTQSIDLEMTTVIDPA